MTHRTGPETSNSRAKARGNTENQRSLRSATALAALLLLPQAVWADSYRLVAGDEVRLVRPGASTTIEAEMRIDSDGQIRLPDLGALGLAGATLDEAETRIAGALEARSGLLGSQVSLSIIEYAPVVVAGDVGVPGALDYIPGMTVATAMALAGGGATAFGEDPERGRSAAAAAMRTANLEIAAAAAELARHRAALVQDATVGLSELPPDLAAAIPAPQAVDLERLLADEAAILAAQRARTAELLGFWDNEIAAFERQSANFADRVAVQAEIVESAASALEDARALQERGLQTATRMADAERRDADARSQMLELEAAQISTDQAIAQARRDRAQYLAELRAEALEGARLTRLQIERATLVHSRQLELIALLSGGNAGAMLTAGEGLLRFRLVSPREGRGGEVDLETPVYPGETLVVTIGAADG